MLTTVTLIDADDTQLECAFRQVNPNRYECFIEGVSVEDDELQVFLITGNHLDNRTNLDVTHFQLTNTNIPFVISQVFFTFPYLEEYAAFNSGLRRIQAGAIQNARHLITFDTFNNRNLTSIEPGAFAGASSVQSVLFSAASITKFHPNAFIGLTNLQQLSLNDNRIRELPANVLRPLPRLLTFFFVGNSLEVLKTETFRFNSRLRNLYLGGNRINAMSPDFLRRNPNLIIFFLRNNACIDSNFLFGVRTVEEAEVALRFCFENFGEIRAI
jgi:Leucine-rich repeat (LRR) protein